MTVCTPRRPGSLSAREEDPPPQPRSADVPNKDSHPRHSGKQMLNFRSPPPRHLNGTEALGSLRVVGSLHPQSGPSLAGCCNSVSLNTAVLNGLRQGKGQGSWPTLPSIIGQFAHVSPNELLGANPHGGIWGRPQVPPSIQWHTAPPKRLRELRTATAKATWTCCAVSR